MQGESQNLLSIMHQGLEDKSMCTKCVLKLCVIRLKVNTILTEKTENYQAPGHYT